MRFAVIKDGLVENVIIADQAFIDAHVAPKYDAVLSVDLNDKVGPGHAYDGKVFTSPGDPVLAPEKVTAICISKDTIELVWISNSSTQTGFMIERSLDGKRFKQLASLPADQTKYADSGLTPGTYYYQVSSIMKDGSTLLGSPAPVIGNTLL